MRSKRLNFRSLIGFIVPAFFTTFLFKKEYIQTFLFMHKTNKHFYVHISFIRNFKVCFKKYFHGNIFKNFFRFVLRRG